MELVNTGGRPVKELNTEDVQVVEALASVLTKQQLAEHFGMTEKTFRAIEERQPEVFTAYRKGRSQAIFEVGSKLLNSAKEGDMRAIQFYLKTQAGWSEKNHLELARAEPTEPSDNHWTWEVMTVAPGDFTCDQCGHENKVKN